MRQVFLDGKFIPESEAKISIFDRSVQFADSIYEVLSVIDGKIVDFDGHMNRMERSLQHLSMRGGPIRDEWLNIFGQLIDDNDVTEGILYLQVTRGTAERDFQYPDPKTPLTIIAYTQEKPLVDNVKCDSGFSVMLVPDLRWGRCDIKTTQLLYASMMKQQAKASGYDDAWMVHGNNITEGTSNNAAIITHDNELITHKISSSILAGTTRNIVLELAVDAGIKVSERPFTIDEAMAAKEAFVSAASLFIMPVTMIDDKKIGSGNVGTTSMMLRKKYIDWARKTSL